MSTNIEKNPKKTLFAAQCTSNVYQTLSVTIETMAFGKCQIKTVNDWVNVWVSALVSEWVIDWISVWVRALVNECVFEQVSEWGNVCLSKWVGEWVRRWVSVCLHK